MAQRGELLPESSGGGAPPQRRWAGKPLLVRFSLFGSTPKPRWSRDRAGCSRAAVGRGVRLVPGRRSVTMNSSLYPCPEGLPDLALRLCRLETVGACRSGCLKRQACRGAIPRVSRNSRQDCIRSALAALRRTVSSNLLGFWGSLRRAGSPNAVARPVFAFGPSRASLLPGSPGWSTRASAFRARSAGVLLQHESAFGCIRLPESPVCWPLGSARLLLGQPDLRETHLVGVHAGVFGLRWPWARPFWCSTSSALGGWGRGSGCGGGSEWRGA